MKSSLVSDIEVIVKKNGSQICVLQYWDCQADNHYKTVSNCGKKLNKSNNQLDLD